MQHNRIRPDDDPSEITLSTGVNLYPLGRRTTSANYVPVEHVFLLESKNVTNVGLLLFSHFYDS